MSREHRLAVLVATVAVLGARATDDVLELFDLLMTTELLSKTERESKDEKLRHYRRVSSNAGRLAEGWRCCWRWWRSTSGSSCRWCGV